MASVLVSVFTTVGLIRLVERSARPRRITLLAVGCLIVAQIGLWAAAGSVWGVLAALLCLFTGINFLEARLPAEVTLTAGPERRGAALGVYASAQFLGVFAGGASAGAILSVSRPEMVFIFAAIMAAIWLVLRARAFDGQSTE